MIRTRQSYWFLLVFTHVPRFILVLKWVADSFDPALFSNILLWFHPHEQAHGVVEVASRHARIDWLESHILLRIRHALSPYQSYLGCWCSSSVAPGLGDWNLDPLYCHHNFTGLYLDQQKFAPDTCAHPARAIRIAIRAAVSAANLQNWGGDFYKRFILGFLLFSCSLVKGKAVGLSFNHHFIPKFYPESRRRKGIEIASKSVW